MTGIIISSISGEDKKRVERELELALIKLEKLLDEIDLEKKMSRRVAILNFVNEYNRILR